MKRAEALKRIVELERKAAAITASIAAAGQARAGLTSDALERLTEAFPNPAKAEAFLAAMPKSPGAEAVLKAFGSAAELTKLVDTTLGGSMRALAVLAERGCNRDPAKLKTFAATFDGDADFKVVFTQGGLAERPEALAALLQGGCESDPVKLKSLCEKFKDPADAKKLAGALGAGGLAQSPEALGALAAEGNGTALKDLAGKFTTPDDHKALTDLLAKGGLGGKAPGRPGLLSDVIKNGFAGDSAKLKDLHAAFAGAGDDGFRQMGDLFTGLDGDDGKGGERIKSAMDGFKAHGAATDADAAKKLRSPYMTSIEKKGRAAAAPDIAGPSARRGGDAAAAIPVPPAEVVAGRLGAALATGGNIQPDARALALILGPEAAALADGPAEIAARAAGLGKLGVSGNPDEAYTTETKAQTEALNKAVAALLKPPGGAPAKDIAAVQTLTDTLLGRLTDEPDGAAHAAAILAATAAGKAIGTVLTRVAAAALAKSGAAGAVLADISQVQTLRAGATEDEKTALKALGAGAASAAAVAVAAGAVPADTSKAAKAEVDLLDVGLRGAETDKRNTKAEAATKLALAVTEEIKAAPVPVDPALVARVAALAADCVDAARAAPDETKAKNAFDAAKLAAEAAAAAAARAAAASKQAAAMGSAEAKKALVAGTSCDRAQAMLTAAGKAADATDIGEIAKAVRAGALSIDAAERALLVAEAAATDAAKDAVSRLPGDPATVTGKANDDAKDAGALAAAEALKLDTPPVTKALILAAQTAGQDALRLAAMAVDPAVRKLVLEQARDALKKVAAASAAFAVTKMDVARLELVVKQGTASAATSAARKTLIDDWLTPGGSGTMTAAPAAAAFDEGRAAISDSAGALLSTLVLTDGGVGTARDAAVEAAALAAVPGASRSARIAALEKARDADKALAVKALTDAEAAVGALPAVPGGPDVANLTALVSSAFRDATAWFEAANGCAAKWRESAVAVSEGVRIALAELAKIPVKTQTDTDDVNTLTPKTALAEAEVEAAKTQQGKFKKFIEGGSPVFEFQSKVAAWVTWINANGHQANAQAADLFTTDAVARAQANEGSRNGAANFTAMPRETLIRNAATLKRTLILPGALTDDLENGSMDAPNDIVIRKKHIAGRHVRETYEYGNLDDGGPTPDDYAASKLIAARYPSGVVPASHGNKLRTLRNLGKELEKVNSLMPEEVDSTNLSDTVEKVLAKARDSLPATDRNVAGMIAAIGTAPQNFWRLDVEIDFPPKRTITVGIKDEGGKPKADMMYGDSKNTMTMPDMAAMGRAVGL